MQTCVSLAQFCTELWYLKSVAVWDPNSHQDQVKFPNNASAEAKNNYIVSHIQDYGNVLFYFPLKYLISTIVSVLLTSSNKCKEVQHRVLFKGDCHQKTLLLQMVIQKHELMIRDSHDFL